MKRIYSIRNEKENIKKGNIDRFNYINIKNKDGDKLFATHIANSIHWERLGYDITTPQGFRSLKQ